ncbi:glycosyltransferase family 15 protein [Lenzites betulinus]|nr:glycosyltransferase family 15 protein [Lenzites betulinus]
MSSAYPPGLLHGVHTKPYRPRRRICSRTRLVWLVVAGAFIISIHSLLLYTRPGYSDTASFSSLSTHIGWSKNTSQNATESQDTESPSAFNETRRANAVLLMLARNSELEGAMASVRELEERFNKHYGYPWLFLNEVPFTDEFKQNISSVVSGSLQFGLIPPEDWYQPEWIDEEKAAAGRAQMVAENVIYGESVSYRNMCRFNSGFFYRQPLVAPYKWYWRVEPNVHFTCDVRYDPFVMMEDQNKVYGFTITLHEWPKTVVTLWDAVKGFIDQNPQYLAVNNSMDFLSLDAGETYNMCHFWSNFEIANMDFWRGEAYTKFFEHLESQGGFYYEARPLPPISTRWGDAPVHSIGAGLFAPKDQLHFFDNIGYRHDPLEHCPRDAQERRELNCSCMPYRSYDYQYDSCLRKWEQVLSS